MKDRYAKPTFSINKYDSDKEIRCKQIMEHSHTTKK